MPNIVNVRTYAIMQNIIYSTISTQPSQ